MLCRAPFLVLLVLAACSSRMSPNHRFDNAADWAARFDDPARDGWQKPDEVVAALNLPPDAVVADIGSATGYFATRLARAVPRGKVYGVDIESSMVEYLERRAAEEGLTNLTSLLGEPADPRLPERVDLVLLVNTYHHIDARPAYFRKLASTVKPGGRLVIVDYRMSSSRGPDHKLPVEQVIDELGQAGWGLSSRPDFLPDQYMLIFTRPV